MYFCLFGISVLLLEARSPIPALRKPPCGNAHHEHSERYDEKLTTMGHRARIAVETPERYKPIAPRHRTPPFSLLLVGGWLRLLFLVDDPSLEPIVLLREAVHDRFTRLVPAEREEKETKTRFQGVRT